MVRHRQIQPHQLEQRADQPLGLAQRLVKHCPQDQRCLDGEIRVARLTARRGPRRRPPRCNRFLREPDRQRAALPKPSLVGLPVRHLVAGFGIRWRRSALYLCGMVRQGDQEGACLLSNVIRLGNRGIPAPNHRPAPQHHHASDWNSQKSSRKPLCLLTPITVSTANLLVNRRMNKSQQMRWSRRGADLLLQVRCAGFNGKLGSS